MTNPREIQCDSIQAKLYEAQNLAGELIEGEEVLSVDFTKDGRDLGGHSAEDVVLTPLGRTDDGLLRVSVRHIMGRKIFVGPMTEEDYLLLSSYFDGYQVEEGN